MCVTDHDSGALVRAAPGRSQTTAEAFYETHGTRALRQLHGGVLDLHGRWIGAVRSSVSSARICADPFHIIKLAGDRTILDALEADNHDLYRAWPLG